MVSDHAPQPSLRLRLVFLLFPVPKKNNLFQNEAAFSSLSIIYGARLLQRHPQGEIRQKIPHDRGASPGTVMPWKMYTLNF